ncbi:MAG TPA: hydroxymethylbilane synthase [Actinomycetales bacterium]|nr:hydroxymethylbilane synthase [Actinomycetales bacterium]
MTSPLRLGTRASALATTQSQTVADALQRATGREVVLVEVTTFGDTSRAHLSEIGGTGVFAAALRQAVLDGEVDLAVHSLKDLPTAPVDGLVVAAVPRREDPRDVLVARDGLTLGTLPEGARLGTGSPRRQAQLLAVRPDLRVQPVRGNVDRRLAMVTDGTMDAVVLAHAGLLRIGRVGVVTDVLAPDQVLPAPGQGALAVECRSDDRPLVEALALLDHTPSRSAVTAERALLAALEAGCTAPVGALASVVDDELRLSGVAAATDGSVVLRGTLAGPVTDAATLGRRLAEQLLADGAARLVERSSNPAAPAPLLAAPPTTTPPSPFEPSPERAS